MTLKYLREQECCTVEKVEYWNPYGGVRKPDGTACGVRHDCFGFIDLLAIWPGWEPEGETRIVGVQCTGPSGHAAHRRKIIENDAAPEWLSAGGKILLISWHKRKPPTGGRERWLPRIEEITLNNVERDDHGKEENQE